MGEKRYQVGFDLGGTKMMAVVFDEKWRPVERRRVPTRARQGDAVEVARIIKTIEDCIADAGVDFKNVSVIGVGSPGEIDPNAGVIMRAGNLGWEKVHLARDMSKHFGVRVAVNNDVNCGTYAEHSLGVAKGFKHVVAFFPGTGIGGALIADGRMFKGSTGAAGELGHMVLDPLGTECGCGRRGCLETVASRLAIARESAVAIAQGRAPALAAERPADVTQLRSKAIARSIASGDAAIERIVRKAAASIGLAAANMVNVFSPEAILLGGGLVEAMPDIFREEVEKGVRTYALAFLAKDVKVLVSKFGDDAIALGAAALAAGD